LGRPYNGLAKKRDIRIRMVDSEGIGKLY